MHVKLIKFLILLFLFTQVSCVMSEAREIFLEASEHLSTINAAHDQNIDHDEAIEHENEMPESAHCVHSHPPTALISSEFAIISAPSHATAHYNVKRTLYSLLYSPPLTPPRS